MHNILFDFFTVNSIQTNSFFTILTRHIVRLYRGFELYQTHEIYKEQMSNWLIFFSSVLKSNYK